ncbi:MAG: amino acid permease, partial [Candidatus Liptonbacteria bacterium]|nr:amino acid permease [Candidatus Liptonbacteria bacterium]
FPALIAKMALILLTSAMAVILLIAANTSFAGLPQLASILAKDRFLPKQFRNRGDRQVYSIGIIILAVISSLFIYIFDGRVSPLIPFYGIGVFTTFSMLGWSMVAHVIKPKPGESDAEAPRDKKTLAVGLIAGIISTVVLAIFLITKFTQGAFAVAIIVPLLVIGMRKIRANYARYEKGLRLEEGKKFRERHSSNTIIIPVGKIDRSTLKALNRAKDINGKKIAIHVAEDDVDESKLRDRWNKLETGIPITVLRTEFNSLSSPILSYIDSLIKSENDKELEDSSYIHHIYVVLTEIVPDRGSEILLHNQMAFFIYEQLRASPEVTPIIVRYVPSKLPASALHLNSKNGGGSA